MKKQTKTLAIILVCLISTIVFIQCTPKIKKAPEIALEDFFRNPEKSSYQISPNGEYYSYMAPFQNRMNIFIQKIGADEAIRVTEETDRDIAGYYWANDDRIIYMKDNGGDENYFLVGVNRDGSNLISLTEFPGVRTQLIDDLEDIPSEAIIGLNKRNPQIFDAYRLNIETGEMQMIAENPGNIEGWIDRKSTRLNSSH